MAAEPVGKAGFLVQVAPVAPVWDSRRVFAVSVKVSEVRIGIGGGGDAGSRAHALTLSPTPLHTPHPSLAPTLP